MERGVGKRKREIGRGRYREGGMESEIERTGRERERGRWR